MSTKNSSTPTRRGGKEEEFDGGVGWVKREENVRRPGGAGHATRAAWDGTRLIQFRERKELRKSPGPVEIDPVERDIIQNVYIREVEKRDDRPVNVDIDEVRMVKDPWKID